MILRLQGVYKLPKPARIWITQCLRIFLIINLVEAVAYNLGKDAVKEEEHKNDLNNTDELVGDTLFDHDYLKHFLEPVSKTMINNKLSSWRMKEMDSVLKLWNKSGQEFKIITEDGYILSLFRITPSPSNANEERPLAPILLLHGFLAAPEIFLTRGEEDLG
ncbi:hypothetical protein WDU94_010978 [Cyamophila willieti]